MDNLESINNLFREFLQSLNLHITDEFFDTIIQDNLQKGAYTLYLLGDYLTNIPHLYETSKAPPHTCLFYSKYLNIYRNITQPISNFSSVITTNMFNSNGLEIKVIYNNADDNLTYKSHDNPIYKCTWVDLSDNLQNLPDNLQEQYRFKSGQCKISTTETQMRDDKIAISCIKTKNPAIWNDFCLNMASSSVCARSDGTQIQPGIPWTSINQNNKGFISDCNALSFSSNNLRNSAKFIYDHSKNYEKLYQLAETACNNSSSYKATISTKSIYDSAYCTYFQRYGKLQSQTGGLYTQAKKNVFGCTSVKPTKDNDCSYGSNVSPKNGNPDLPGANGPNSGPFIPGWMFVKTTYSWWWGGGQRHFTEIPFPYYYFNAFNDRYSGTNPKQCGESVGWDSSPYCTKRWGSLYGSNGNAGDEITCSAVRKMQQLVKSIDNAQDSTIYLSQDSSSNTYISPIDTLVKICEDNNIENIDTFSYSTTQPKITYSIYDTIGSSSGDYMAEKSSAIPAMDPSKIDAQPVTKLLMPSGINNKTGLDFKLLNERDNVKIPENNFDTSYVTMNDPDWGIWDKDKWDWLKDGSSIWTQNIQKEPLCHYNYNDTLTSKILKNDNIHKITGSDKYAVDFSGIYKAALAGTGSKKYSPFFTIAAAGESQFDDICGGLGAVLSDPNGIWQMTGLGTIIADISHNGFRNYIDIICSAPVTACDSINDETLKGKCKSGNNSEGHTNYFASLKNPCCCAKLAKFWMDNTDPYVGQSCFSTSSNVVDSWGGRNQCQSNAPLRVPYKEVKPGSGTMDAYMQGTGQMESAYNTNFLGPICHLSGTKSGGSFQKPPPPTPPCKMPKPVCDKATAKGRGWICNSGTVCDSRDPDSSSYSPGPYPPCNKCYDVSKKTYVGEFMCCPPSPVTPTPKPKIVCKCDETKAPCSETDQEQCEGLSADDCIRYHTQWNCTPTPS